MEITISIRKTIRLLFAVLVVFFTGSLAAHLIGVATGHWSLGGLSQFVNLDGEQSAPTWFNSLLLALLFAATWAIAHFPHPETVRHHGRWKLLSVVFLAMSVDEVATVHEAVGRLVGGVLNAKGYFYFAFVIPGALLAAGLFLYILPVLKRLPRKTALGMVLAGGIYLSGALVVEAMSGNWNYERGERGFVYKLLTDFEELLEMGGLILLLKVLCEYLHSLQPGALSEWRIRLGR